MIGEIFVDTNVLIYARDASRPDKQERAAAWVTTLIETRRGRLSTQVLQEYYNAVTRKLRPAMPVEHARADVRVFQVWRPVSVDAEVLALAWRIEDRYRLSWWDSMIVAAAQRAGCRYLLTEDLQSGQMLDQIEIVNPFGRSPTELR